MPKIRSKKLQQALNDFCEEMGRRLSQKERKGYRGWDDIMYANNILKEAIGDLDKIENGMFMSQEGLEKLTIDIANRCMMLWYQSKNQ